MFNAISAMSLSIVHRGPDDYGHWIDAEAGVALGHRRLSIIDLSAAGRQPMISESGRYVIVFNGEIYNHLDLRTRLKNCHWKSSSDTETILAAFEAWGFSETLSQINGMFAIALWDTKVRCLYLARDRMGEKPLYYGWDRGVFLFGSELKALRHYPSFTPEIDRNSLSIYTRYGYIPAPLTIYEKISKLMPGSYLRIDMADRSCEKQLPVQYWSLIQQIKNGCDNPFEGNDEEAIAELSRLISDSVQRQKISDVPIGAFLSGGIDSSTIVAFMQSQTSQPVKTFSIGFQEDRYNEAKYAQAVAKYLGTDHTELYVNARQAMDVIPKLPLIYDEPFGDASQIPTFLVSQLARKNVTVAMSGDGGDELFCGYTRYTRGGAIWNIIDQTPVFLREKMAFGLQNFLGEDFKKKHYRFERLRSYLECMNLNEFYFLMGSQWEKNDEIVLQSNNKINRPVKDALLNLCLEPQHTMMAIDSHNYLPDDILVKVDRAAMAVSLETRVPLLDYRLVEFAWRLPLHMKVRNKQTKWILRQVLHRVVPKELVERPKMGFGVPVDEWIRGPLREWAEDLLSEKSLLQDGFFNPEPIRRRWKQHLSGKRNSRDCLWIILMFQAWKRFSKI